MRKILASLMIYCLSFQSLLYAQEQVKDSLIVQEKPSVYTEALRKLGFFKQMENYTKDLYYHQEHLQQLQKQYGDWFAQGAKDPATMEAMSQIEVMLEELKNYEKRPEFADPWKLKGQILLDHDNKKQIFLDREKNRSLIEDYSMKFSDQVEFRVTRKGNVYFEFYEVQKGEKILRATHNFINMNAVKLVHDAEFIHILNKSGEIYTMTKSTAETFAFKGPAPWILTGKVRPEVMREISENLESFRMSYLTQGVKPHDMVIHEKAIRPMNMQSESYFYKAHDLMLSIETNEGRKLMGLYDVTTMRALVAESLNSLHEIMSALTVNGDVKEKRTPGAEVTEESQKRLLSIYENELKISNKIIDNVLIEAKNNGLLAKTPPQSDLFTYLEWRQGFEEISKNAEQRLVEGQATEETLQRQWQELQTRELHKVKRMPAWMKTGIWALAGITTFFAVDYAFYAERYGEVPVWMAWTIAKIHSVVPDQVFENAYFWVAGVSVVWLLLALPLVDMVAKIAGKAKNLSGYVAIALGGIRFRAAMVIPFHVMYATVARQKNYTKAAGEGLKPWQTVKADSKIGKQLGLTKDITLGTNSLFQSFTSEEGKALDEAQKKAIALSKEQSNRKQALAWMLASLVVSKRNNIDPATLTWMFKTGASSVTKEQLADEEFKKEWTRTARNIHDSLKDLNELSEKDFKQLNVEEMMQYYRQARDIARQQIKPEIRETLKARWNNAKIRYVYGAKGGLQGDIKATRNLMPQVKEQAKEMYRSAKSWSYDFFIRDANWEKLHKGIPNDFIANQTVTQFKEDYKFSAWLMVLGGARANMDAPIYLAADPEGPLMNTRPHAVDMIEQVFIYMVPAMAANFLVYQDDTKRLIAEPVNIDPTYNPKEYFALDGNRKDASKLTSWGQFFKEITNLKKMGYGHVLMKKFTVKWTNLRAQLITGVPVMTIAGIDPISATLAVLWANFVGEWVAGWAWIPAWQGPDQAQKTYTEKNRILREAKAEISQGVRTRDFSMVESGYDKLQDLYHEFGLEFGKRMEKAIDRFYRVIMKSAGIEVTRSSLKNFKAVAKSSLGLQVELREAIINQDESKLENIRERLINLYSKHQVASDKLLTGDALNLLKFSIENPPIPRNFNQKVNQNIQLMTGGITTFLFSYMFANILDPEADALSRLIDGAVWGTALFIGAKSLQSFVIDPIGDWLGERKMYYSNQRKFDIRVRSCANAFL